MEDLINAGAIPFVKKKLDQDSIVLYNNDIFHLAIHPSLIKSQLDFLKKSNTVVLSASVHSDENSTLRNLELEYAKFLKAESVVFCQSGYIANISLLQTIILPYETHAFIDEEAHVSLFNGLKMQNAIIHIFKHNDFDSLREFLTKFPPGVIIVDAIYSTDGSICPLKKVVELSIEFNCEVLVDESHSLGLIASDGAGLVASLNLENSIRYRTASLSKAFAGRAGIIVAPPLTLMKLKYSAASMVCSTALLPIDTVLLKKSLFLIKSFEKERLQLQYHSETLRKFLEENNIVYNGSLHLLCFKFETFRETVLFSNWLESNNIFAALYFPPAMPPNSSMVRLTLNSKLSNEEIKRISTTIKSGQFAIHEI